MACAIYPPSTRIDRGHLPVSTGADPQVSAWLVLPPLRTPPDAPRGPHLPPRQGRVRGRRRGAPCGEPGTPELHGQGARLQSGMRVAAWGCPLMAGVCSQLRMIRFRDLIPQDGKTPLSTATAAGRTEVVKVLLAKGADADKQSSVRAKPAE